LGNIGRSKFYSDLLPELDVVKFGTRTFITLESLERLIAANCQLAVEADEESNEPIRQTTISISAAPDASRRCPRLEQLGRANVRIRPTGHERAASLAESRTPIANSRTLP
jgi:hypothetical protein